MAAPHGSALVTLLKDELAVQRTFVSSDEEIALQRPVSYDDENDLAWDRIKHRRLVFFTALRERFIQDGRPLEELRAMIAAEEAWAGEPTYVTQLATQVLEWATRTSDRGAMLGGFAAKTARWAGIVLVLLGAFALFNGNRAGGIAFLVLGVVLFAVSRALTSFTAQRTAALKERLHSEPADGG
jgi:hypothetical protein